MDIEEYQEAWGPDPEAWLRDHWDEIQPEEAETLTTQELVDTLVPELVQAFDARIVEHISPLQQQINDLIRLVDAVRNWPGR